MTGFVLLMTTIVSVLIEMLGFVAAIALVAVVVVFVSALSFSPPSEAP